MIRNESSIRAAIAVLAAAFFAASAQADTRTISAVIPWQGQGEIFPVSTDGLRFLGDLEGIMYIESAEGDMNEAFVRCPIVQNIDTKDGSTSATGSCMIVVSPGDTVFAELTCDGVEGLCRGEFKLTGGTGRFTGISGSGQMVARSPVHAMAADLTQGTVLNLAAGILQIRELRVTTP